MFKDVAVYTNPSMSNYSVPRNSAEAVTHIYLKDSREVRSMTSGDFVRAAESLWTDHLQGAA
jgi:hypothetical protein